MLVVVCCSFVCFMLAVVACLLLADCRLLFAVCCAWLLCVVFVMCCVRLNVVCLLVDVN